MKPNVLIINPDQMRADAMRHLGNEAAYTPNLDALAEEGVSFSNAFCQNPVCVPSRCSFMTGRYPHTHGHRTMAYLLRPGEKNLFHDMKAAGYTTISSTRGDLMAGQYTAYHRECIDEYIRARGERGDKMQDPRMGTGSSDADDAYSFYGGIIPTDRDDGLALNIDDFTVAGAIRSIQERPKDKPFFMFLALIYPHPPYQIEQKYYDLIDKTKLPERIPTIQDTDGKPAMETALRDALGVSAWPEARLDEIRTVYLAMCAKIDDQVGQLIQALKDEGIYDDTTILFFSDHGDYTTDYGLVEKAQNCFPDCLTNVPFIVKPAKGVPVDPGVSDALVELTDVYPTVAELAGVTLDRWHFGQSLVPAIGDRQRRHRDFVTSEGGRLFGETQCMEGKAPLDDASPYYPRMKLQMSEDGEHTKAAMLRTERYKYVKRLYERDEFYDLDKGERVNEIDNPDYAGVIEELRAKMLDWYMTTCDTVPKDLDDRMTVEFMMNNMAAMGVPRIAQLAFKVYFKLSGQTMTEYLEKMMKKMGRH